MNEFTRGELLVEALPKLHQIDEDFSEYFSALFSGFIKKGVRFKLDTFNVGYENGWGDGWVTELTVEKGVDPTRYKILSDFLKELTGEVDGTEYATYEEEVLTYFIDYVDGHLLASLKNGNLAGEIYDKDLSQSIAYGLFDDVYEMDIKEILGESPEDIRKEFSENIEESVQVYKVIAEGESTAEEKVNQIERHLDLEERRKELGEKL